VIGLTLRNQSALTNLLEELYNPASPNFRKFLTPDQFIERFGPTESDYQAVIAFAKSNHFVLTGTHPNRLLLDVNCASADIERALHTKLRLFQHPSEPRAFYSPVSEPSLDARLPILSIEGLDDFSLNPVPLSTQPVPAPAAPLSVWIFGLPMPQAFFWMGQGRLSASWLSITTIQAMSRSTWI